METIICSKCGIEYETSSKYFHKNKASKTGFQGWCKTCRNQQAGEDTKDENFIVGGRYRFTIPKLGHGTLERKFTGQAIQLCKHFVVFQGKNYVESFMKTDLNNWGYKEA